MKFVMSDKTGTLTRNVMKFKRCSVGGVNYGDNESDDFSDSSLLENLGADMVGHVEKAFNRRRATMPRRSANF